MYASILGVGCEAISKRFGILCRLSGWGCCGRWMKWINEVLKSVNIDGLKPDVTN